MASREGRQPSGPWSRLKPISIDPLESVGLPSKGDNRLLDFKRQEQYYAKLVDRYMSFCLKAGRGDELLRRFSALRIGTGNSPATNNTLASSPSSRSLSIKDDALPNRTQEFSDQDELSVLMMAMRKLREGIVASKRIDVFSVQAYIFCIRLSILVKHMESYQPALLHLLNKMHLVRPLSIVDLQEFAGYLVLDLACRQRDLTEAYAIRRRFTLKDAKIDAVLRAVVHDNYHLFWQVKRSVDKHKSRLMEFAEPGMRQHALKCIGTTYFTAEKVFVERSTDTTWDVLQAVNQVGWELQGSLVTIRRPKGR